MEESYLQGPITPKEPYDPYERSVLNHAEYGEDFQREQYLHTLLMTLPRALTFSERRAAAQDPGVPPRVYAPAALRISKLPLPCDAEIIEEGRRHTVTDEAARHPGDRSDPSELR